MLGPGSSLIQLPRWYVKVGLRRDATSSQANALEVQKEIGHEEGSSSQRSMKQVAKAGHRSSTTIGMDLGDKNSCYCVLESDGVIVDQRRSCLFAISASIVPSLNLNSHEKGESPIT
jgi:hypothetical protein